MCGRFALVASEQDIEQHFGVKFPVHRHRYNIAPGQQVPLITSLPNGELIAIESMWGLVRAEGDLLINIRAETATKRPFFRRLLTHTRGIVPASGFYEWTGPQRQPYYISSAEMTLMGFAALYLVEQESTGTATYRCAILTRASDPAIASLHPRMPVIVPSPLEAEWLSTRVDGSEILQPLLIYSPARWRFHPVSRRVGNVKYDDPQLIEPVVVPDSLL